ncbi:hypothetical protein GDO81_006254 [Engystomops pustulosus]|uniref:Periphilin-1 C-terminal domain-containing protein n=1 Tax=Engystomops pustulosus TaxID=76066 RepID=A0AAV7CVW3_ENGPU|nr:hypothetical protein GDO81_006254 [Engystomops pustulosus]KAG8589098.1 hypothetical protein GDO81_006254 [Engystomops pustulosus]KAG8589099.1 hypothetical protein GDO81_006254 [Engystomops pustulosus]
MYHRGGDRGWHRGHPPRDIPPSRNHRPRPYRGGYHDRREHDGYGPYHENSCNDRNFNDNQFVEYQEHSYPEYYEENQMYNEYREHREPAFNRGCRHDGGYHKESYYRGGYQREHGESSRYRGNNSETPHRKYSHKPVKAHKKENEVRMKTSTPQPAQKVNHNPVRTIVTPGVSEDESEMQSKSKSSELQVKSEFAKPSQDITELEGFKKEDVIVEITTPPNEHKDEAISACDLKMEITESSKEDALSSEQATKTEELYTSVNPGKRAHSEEKDVGIGAQQRDEELFVGKRMHSNQDKDEHRLEQTLQIPLLGCWGDTASESNISASTSEQEHLGSAVNCKLPETARELRTAFILARKEQLEGAFAQDCKTFAFVASTLLKKDPSIEAAVTSALHSSLQEMAGLCVQELHNFIDRYDSGM